VELQQLSPLNISGLTEPQLFYGYNSKGNTVSYKKKVKSRIWTILKRGVPVTAEDVLNEVGRLDKKEVNSYLEHLVKRGILQRDMRTYCMRR